MIEIRLSPQELEHAALNGVRQHIESICSNRRDYHGCNGKAHGWQYACDGMVAQLVMCRYLGLEYRSTVGEFRSKSDLPNGDDVRSGPYYNHPLIVRPRDDLDKIYWLVITTEQPLYRIAGWLWGHEVRKLGWFGAINKSRPPAWNADQDCLHPPHTRSMFRIAV